MKTKRTVVLWAAPLFAGAVLAACFWPRDPRPQSDVSLSPLGPSPPSPEETVPIAVSPAGALTRADVAQYAGSGTCETCHAEIAADYRDSAMARSWRQIEQPLPAFIAEAKPYLDPHSGYQYQLVVDDGRLYQQETSVSGGAHRLCTGLCETPS